MNTTLSVICFTETLKRYHELNEVLPQIIVVYRDGADDGQLEVFINHEHCSFSLRICLRTDQTRGCKIFLNICYTVTHLEITSM